MKLAEIRERRTTVQTEMRKLYDTAEAAGEDLSGDKLEKWESLKKEEADLAAKEERAQARDALDRTAQDARQVESRDAVELRAGEVRILTPEQRMADLYARRDGEPLSAGRAICGLLSGNWAGAEAERRTMATNSSPAGGYLLSDELSAMVIDKARNASVLIAAGAGTIPMTSATLRIVGISSDPTAAWRGEGATISESDGAFNALNLSARSLAALVRCNVELLEDAPSFQATIEAQLSAALALEIDRAGLYGTGTVQPWGLRTYDNVNETSMGNNGAALTDYDVFLEGLKKVEDYNGAATAAIFAPRTKLALAKLKTGISGDLTKLTPPADYLALRRLVSNQVSVTETQGSATTASTAFLGDFTQMAVAIRSNIQIEASKVADTTFAKNQILIRAIMRADIAILRPAHFCRIVGIVP